MKEYLFLPEDYQSKCISGSQLEIFHYHYNDMNKQCLIYLPENYNANTQYKFVYLMHGGGGDIDRLFGGIEASRPLKNTLDWMIHDGMIEPMIFVCPTYYPENHDRHGDSSQLVKDFYHEAIEAMIPAVEGHYGSISGGKNLKETRNTRAFGGYSMGSVTTYWMFLEAFEYFQYYIPMSGDCWIMGQLGGGKYPEKTADALSEFVSRQTLPFLICQVVGKAGIAYENVLPQIQAMYDHEEFTDENLYYFESPYVHDSIYANEYLFNVLPCLFK